MKPYPSVDTSRDSSALTSDLDLLRLLPREASAFGAGAFLGFLIAVILFVIVYSL